MRHFIVALITLAPMPVLAQDVVDCDWKAKAENIAEPWEDNARLFSNGAVRIAKLDTIEPAFGGFHLLVLSPPYQELGERQCRVITWEQTVGFAGIDFDTLEAAYDPSIGLMFSVLVRVASGGDFSNSALLSFALNQATGEIGTRLDLGGE